MWALILLGLIFGCLFLFLASGSFRRRQDWRGAVRLKAQVADVRYQEVWGRGKVIEDDKSTTEVTLRFFYGGQEHIKRKDCKGIIGTPSRGQKFPILFKPQDGTWAFRREARSYWGLLFALGALCLLVSLAAVIDGRGLLADLSDFRVQSPNLPGSVFFLLMGVILAACTYACVRGLLPYVLRSILSPVCWAVKNALGQFDAVDARCEGIICKRGGEDSDTYYPLFSCAEGGTRWYSRDSVMKKKYRAGDSCTLYRDRRTGSYALKPTALDVVRIFFSLFLLNFLLMFILSLAVCSVGMIYGAVAGYLLPRPL